MRPKSAPKRDKKRYRKWSGKSAPPGRVLIETGPQNEPQIILKTWKRGVQNWSRKKHHLTSTARDPKQWSIRTWPAGQRACLTVRLSTFHSFPSFYLLHLTHSPPSITLPSISFLQLFFRFLQVIYLKVDYWGGTCCQPLHGWFFMFFWTDFGTTFFMLLDQIGVHFGDHFRSKPFPAEHFSHSIFDTDFYLVLEHFWLSF